MKLEVVVSLVATLIISAVLTPFVRMLAFKIGAEDLPNKRRMNKIPMPTIGGIAVFIAYTCATMFMLNTWIPNTQLWGIFAGELVIILTGLTDDLYVLKPHQKIIGITIAAMFVYFFGKMKMGFITVPFIGSINLGWLSLPITLIWILAITNAVNLIDGLDGLATGVSIIALSTMGITGFFTLGANNLYLVIMIFTLVASLAGFLPYNFFPARIYLGDTGSLFIGFMMSIFSLGGLKNATFISVLIPVIIMGVPITDTIYAIIRRLLNKQPIAHADKKHLHHRLMQIGLTERQTVLVIYGIATIFAFISLLYPLSNMWGNILLTVATLIGIEIFVESIDLADKHRQPLLDGIKWLVKSTTSKSNHSNNGNKITEKSKSKHKSKDKSGNAKKDKNTKNLNQNDNFTKKQTNKAKSANNKASKQTASNKNDGKTTKDSTKSNKQSKQKLNGDKKQDIKNTPKSVIPKLYKFRSNNGSDSQKSSRTNKPKSKNK